MIRRSLTVNAGVARPTRASSMSPLQSQPPTTRDLQSLSSPSAASSDIKSDGPLSYAEALPFLLADDDIVDKDENAPVRFELVRELFESVEVKDPERLQAIFGTERYVVSCTPEDTVADVVHRCLQQAGHRDARVKMDVIWEMCKHDDVIILDEWVFSNFLS